MNYPSLKVCGNPDKNAGDQVLYSLNGGNIIIHEYEMGDVPYFNVNITNYDVQYVFVPNKNVKSHSSIRDSYCLKMGISIPRHYRLKDGVSPYDVLMAVYETMKKENLSEIYGTSNLQYNERMCEESVFKTLLQKYPLEEYKSAYRPMNGSSAALLVTDKISEFMKDPHYPELQRYSEVIVATAGAYPDRVPDLPIPRVPQFSLYVNGELRVEILNANSPIEPIQWRGIDERCYYVPSPIKISMSDIINNHYGPQGVNVDWEKERIDCTLPKPEPRTETWYVKIEGVSNPQAFFNRIQVCLTTKNGKTPVNVNLSGLFSLKGEEIIAPKEALYNGADYSISTLSENADLRQIYVRMTKKIVPPPPPKPDPTPTNRPQKIAIILPPKAFADNGKDHSGKIKWYPKGEENKTVYYCEKVEFKPKWGNEDEDEVELWFSEVVLPPCLQANNGQLYISVKTKKAIYNGNAQIKVNNKYGIDCKTDKFIDLTDEEAWTFFSFWKRRGELIFYLFALLLAFAVGIELGVQAERNWSTGHLRDAPPVAETPDSIRAAELIEQYRCLDNDSVTFDEIEWLNTAIKNVNDEVLEYLPEKEGMLMRAEAYYKVVEKLRNANACDDQFVEELVALLNSTKVYCNGYFATNLSYCRYLYKPEKYGVSGKNLKRAQEIFLEKKQKGEINRFTDLESIKDEVDKEVEEEKARTTSHTQTAQQTGKGGSDMDKSSAAATPQNGGEGGPDGEH